MTNKKISQEQLREMMNKMKAKAGKGDEPSSDRKRKYKLSSKELVLLEEEKKKRNVEKINEKKEVAAKAGVPENFFDSAKTKAFLNLKQAPKKSILKNSSAPLPSGSKPISSANVKATGKEWISKAPETSVKDKSPKNPKSLLRTPSGGNISHLEEENEPAMEVDNKESEDNALPEGFFDDPQQDARARGIEYKNPEDLEWESFQREIAAEVSVSAEMAAEDQLEETNERQIEEIDEQMAAWSRVRDQEIRKETIEEQISNKKNILNSVELKEEDEEVNDAEMDEFLDWRSKKS